MEISTQQIRDTNVNQWRWEATVPEVGAKAHHYDVVVVQLTKDSEKHKSWRPRILERDSRPKWVENLLPQDAKKSEARVFDFRCVVTEEDCASLSHCMDAQSLSLLSYVEGKRGRAGVERSIVFVAQSVCGLVVTGALTKAAQAQPTSRHRRSIYASTRRIIFFGTPHPSTRERGADWRERVVESLSKYGGLSKNVVKHKLNITDTDILRLQADCYKSIEARICNIAIPEIDPKKPKTQQQLSSLYSVPPEFDKRENWFTFRVGSIDIDTDLDQSHSWSYGRMIDYVGKTASIEVRPVQPSSIGKEVHPRTQAQNLSEEDDVKRLIAHLELKSLVAVETLYKLNDLAKLRIQQEKLEEARYLHERICVAITEVWIHPPQHIDIHTLQNLQSLLQDAAELAGRQGRYEEGIQYLKSSVNLHENAKARVAPKLCQAKADLGVLYSYSGQLKEARQAYSEAIHLADKCDMQESFSKKVTDNWRLTEDLLVKSANKSSKSVGDVALLSLLSMLVVLMASLMSADARWMSFRTVKVAQKVL